MTVTLLALALGTLDRPEIDWNRRNGEVLTDGRGNIKPLVIRYGSKRFPQTDVETPHNGTVSWRLPYNYPSLARLYYSLPLPLVLFLALLSRQSTVPLDSRLRYSLSSSPLPGHTCKLPVHLLKTISRLVVRHRVTHETYHHHPSPFRTSPTRDPTDLSTDSHPFKTTQLIQSTLSNVKLIPHSPHRRSLSPKHTASQALHNFRSILRVIFLLVLILINVLLSLITRRIPHFLFYTAFATTTTITTISSIRQITAASPATQAPPATTTQFDLRLNLDNRPHSTEDSTTSVVSPRHTSASPTAPDAAKAGSPSPTPTAALFVDTGCPINIRITPGIYRDRQTDLVIVRTTPGPPSTDETSASRSSQ
ncbi:hypothetical protein BGW80DRAFT_676006 [Lactifluus volemus]|nr:hypothetical protein BGW80DRAFT_676006 [Lactifluus volemus]